MQSELKFVHASVMMKTVLIASLLFLSGFAKRGRRIDIFSQSGGDIKQIPPGDKSAVMFSALPRKSPLRWNKIKDSMNSNVIPFIISGKYDPEEKEIIAHAMEKIEQNTCIRFKKRAKEKDFIDVQNKMFEGCYTAVGRVPGRNVVMLEANDMATCVEHDIVIHELMHSIGLWHEHMRADRDHYIRVHYENIPFSYYSQFDKIPTTESETYGLRYDYESVMHYAKNAFAKKPGLMSMETIDPTYQDIIGTARDAAPSDYKKICALYECMQCMGKPFNRTSMQSPDSEVHNTRLNTHSPLAIRSSRTSSTALGVTKSPPTENFK